MERRTALQWMLSVAATLALPDPRTADAAAPAAAPAGAGYGTDPSMVRIYKPGDVWPLTFNARQQRVASALCDVIVPADEFSPAASGVGVPEFLDEWVSAPYPAQQGDRRIVLEGLAWMDAESKRRFQLEFAELDDQRRGEICGDLARPDKTKAGLKTAAAFFKRYRDLTLGAYYTTPEGMKAAGYAGNVPLAAFSGPPQEALRHVGLA
jgi:hypothetical protein